MTQKLQKSQRLGQANNQEGRLWSGPSQLLLPNFTGIKKQPFNPATPTSNGQEIYSFTWHFPLFQTTPKAGGILSVTISVSNKTLRKYGSAGGWGQRRPPSYLWKLTLEEHYTVSPLPWEVLNSAWASQMQCPSSLTFNSKKQESALIKFTFRKKKNKKPPS